MTPFLTARATDSSLFGAAQGGEITEAIKRTAEGPKLADVWNLDREIYTLMAAWMDIQQRLATYRAVVTVPWSRAFERYSGAYDVMYETSMSAPEAFWLHHGRCIDWFKPYTKVKNTSFAAGAVSIHWFEDGTTNVGYNCVDRQGCAHLIVKG